MKTLFSKPLKLRSVLFSLPLGIIITWLIKEEITYLLLGGKNFNNRSLFTQISILVILVVIISTLIILFFSLVKLFYTKNKYLRRLVNNIVSPLGNNTFIISESIMTKDMLLGLLCLIVMVGFFSAVVFHYFMGTYLALHYPYNTFLFRPTDRFNDFFNPLRGSFDRDPYNPDRIHFIGGYLPLGYFISFLFSLIRPWQAAFWLFVTGFIGYLWVYIRRALFKHEPINYQRLIYIFSLTFMTYPVLISLDRTNFDILIFIFISLFIHFYQKGNYLLSSIILAIPIAMKGYPILLTVLLLIDRRYREFIFTGLLVMAMEISSLAFFKDGLFVEFSKMIASFSSAFGIAFGAGSLIRFNSSINVLLLYLSRNFAPELAKSSSYNLIYSLVVLILFGFISSRMAVQKFPFWRKYLIVTLMMILFPQSSADYRLLLIYPALLLFLTKVDLYSTDFKMTILFGILLIPKAYIVFESDVNIGILINPLVLLAMLIIAILPSKPYRFATIGIT